MAKTAKIIKADQTLKNKVGAIFFDPEKIKECQDVIENNDFDFAPYADEILIQISRSIKDLENKNKNPDETLTRLTECILQLKSNASTFQYELVGTLATIMLNFLESIKTIDPDAIQIVAAHHKTLHAIIAKRLKGDGGTIGKQFERELVNACQRYQKNNLKNLQH